MAVSIRKFQHFIEGRKLIIYMDHKPLTSSIMSVHNLAHAGTR